MKRPHFEGFSRLQEIMGRKRGSMVEVRPYTAWGAIAIAGGGGWCVSHIWRWCHLLGCSPMGWWAATSCSGGRILAGATAEREYIYLNT